MAEMDAGFNSGLGMAQCYYEASAHPFSRAPALRGAHVADVCVIGAGATGLSAALFARAKGLKVIVLEAGRIGWGASGRNGGQMIPGLRKSADELVRAYGKERARAVFDLSIEARSTVLDLIAKHSIPCDVRPAGHLTCAAKPGDFAAMAKEAETLSKVMNYPHAKLMTRAQVQEKVASPLYHGGLLDVLGGHLHPLNYTLGLADAAQRAGVDVYEQSQAVSIDREKGVVVGTEEGEVSARMGVLACDALLGRLEPRIARSIMPVANYVVATEPLKNPSAIIADNHAVSDSRFVVNYFRLSGDGRLIFGGGERYTPDPPADIAGFVRPYLEKVFPQLAGVRIDYAWGGLVSITRTRLPHFGQLGDLYFAHGYSGMGVLMATFAGKLIAEAMAGKPERFDLMASFAPQAFPGGPALRGPLHTAGMLWYALRDRL
jgi:gamma-glutamylputrescine oxidase